MTRQVIWSLQAADPLDMEAVAELARRIVGGGSCCVRLDDDGRGRPVMRLFPHRPGILDVGPNLPDGHVALPVAEAAQLPTMAFWEDFPIIGPEGDVVGFVAVLDDQPLTLPQGAPSALRLLARGFSASVRVAIHADLGQLIPPATEEAVVCSHFEAFARLRIGEAVHDIGRCDATDRMAFRPMGTAQDWLPLMHSFEEGWPEIAAEIIARTRNAMRDYIRMHMIRHREVTMPDGEREYDLYGLLWRVRGTGEAAEVWQEGTDWVEFDTSPVVDSADPRDLAAQALIAAIPDLDEKIGSDVQGWARRLAQGAQISPILNAA